MKIHVTEITICSGKNYKFLGFYSTSQLQVEWSSARRHQLPQNHPNVADTAVTPTSGLHVTTY